MMLPTNIRQKSSELFPNDAEKQRIFLMGAAFSLGNDLSDFEITTEQNKKNIILAKRLLTCGSHTREKNVRLTSLVDSQLSKRSFYSYQTEIPNTQR